MTPITYHAERLFDGRSPTLLEPGYVVVDGGLIAEVGSGTPVDRNLVVDLGDTTLLPGLIDSHVHLVWNAGLLPHELVRREGAGMTTLRAANNAAAHLRHGVLTVRDLGSTAGIATVVARAVEAGVVLGARVLSAGRAICMTGGHANDLGVEVDGQDAVVHAVRSEIKAGAHHIKVMASGGVYGEAEEVGCPQLSLAELTAAVKTAHDSDRRVAAHAYTAEAITNALDAGVDTVEHASFLTPELAARMQREGVAMVPTLSCYLAIDALQTQGDERLPEPLERKAREIISASAKAFNIARSAGVTILAGTDCGAPNHPHGSTLIKELALMVELGATPLEALRSATADAAAALGRSDIGLLASGRAADLVAVRGNPLEKITDLENISTIIKAGTVALASAPGERSALGRRGGQCLK